MFELVGQKRKLQNRAGDEMGKHRNKAREINKRAHRFGVAAIHINDVAEGLKSVKADAQRQRDLQRGVPLHFAKTQRLHSAVVAIDGEIEVLEKAQQHQIGNNRQRHRRPLRARTRRILFERDNGFFSWLLGRFLKQPGSPNLPAIARDDDAQSPIEERGGEHQKHKLRRGPAVKRVTQKRERQIARALWREKQSVRHQKRERKKVENENVRAENHKAFRERVSKIISLQHSEINCPLPRQKTQVGTPK